MRNSNDVTSSFDPLHLQNPRPSVLFPHSHRIPLWICLSVEVKMVRNDLFIAVPSFFRCPISLDVMKSPVSLCTGVTYDRSSIQAWLDGGNNTCPATMQILPSRDIVPNHTLHRLIKLWSDSLSRRSDSDSSPSPASSSRVSREQVMALIKSMENGSNMSINSLSKILAFAKESDANRSFLAKIDNFVAMIVGVLSDINREIAVLESIVKVLDLIISECGVREQVHKLIFKGNEGRLSSIVLVLRKGSFEAKIGTARLLEAIAFNNESKRAIPEQEGLLYELFHLLSYESDPSSIEAVLSSLIAISTSRPVKAELVRFGIVQTLAKILSDSNSSALITEKALKLLEMLSKCNEGRTMICEDPLCVSAVVQKMMKASSSATEHAVVVVWSVCYLFRDQTAQEAVMKNNGLTKFLLLMQSNCSPMVRQMCNDLVKVFKVNSKSCLACYDTKTTHVMPY